ERALRIERLVEWMSVGPARLAGLEGRKGANAAGYDADLVLFTPDGAIVFREDMLLHRHTVTPYLGAVLRGTVEATYVRGTRAFDRRTGPAAKPPGDLLLQSHP